MALVRLAKGGGGGGEIPSDYERLKISISTYIGGSIGDLLGNTIVLNDTTDGTTENLTIDSSVVYAYVPKNHTYYLVYPSVNGFSKPNNSSIYTAVGQNENIIDVTFEQWTAMLELSWECENSISWSISNGSITIDSGTSTTNGSKTIYIHEIGTYTATATIDGETETETISITELSTYTLTLSADYVTLNISSDDTELQSAVINIYKGSDNTGILLDTVTLVNGFKSIKLGKSKVGNVATTPCNLYIYNSANDIGVSKNVTSFTDYDVELVLLKELFLWSTSKGIYDTSDFDKWTDETGFVVANSGDKIKVSHGSYSRSFSFGFYVNTNGYNTLKLTVGNNGSESGRQAVISIWNADG